MKIFTQKNKRNRAYTLIEALVASGVLLIGISAASSMSLSLVTQEEINERSIKAFNYLDNAARLYRMGLEPAEITATLPKEPVVQTLSFTSTNKSVTGLGNVPVMRISINFKASDATTAQSATIDEWTGGDSTASRTEFVDVLRSESVQSSKFNRSRHFTGP